jgi:acyl-coenzyme A thioesterase PaaI-like protein
MADPNSAIPGLREMSGGSNFDPRLAIQFMGKAGHGGFLGMDYEGHGADWVEVGLDWRADLVGDPETGVLASAVVISLLDNATSMSIWTKLGEFRPQVTMDLRLDYLRPSPKGARVFGRGICYHLTHSIGFVRGIAHNGDINEPLAHASGTFIRVGDRVG